MQKFAARFGHAWVFLYFAVYLPWFYWLEQTVTQDYYILRTELDLRIPFWEGAVIPYLLWFPFVALTVAWFFFHNKSEFYRLILHLYAGMTVFLIVCTIFPNGLDLRPAVLPRDNVCSRLVQFIWAVDTPTNVLPSLHVYNSLACCSAVFRSAALRGRSGVRAGTALLTVSIILSTMLIKQHSIVDVVTALALFMVFYVLIYEPQPQRRSDLVRDRG